jgi:FtsZ-binding cell division protein ZapB
MDALMAQYCPRYAEQMSAIETQLATYMAGGTGLNAAVENAIYERSRSKQDGEARRLQDAAWSSAADRGFTLPNGALVAGLQSARQAAADNNAASAREIVVVQAEMEQKNLQFAVTTSTGLRTTMLNATLAYMQNLTAINAQALDYAKAVLGAIIEVYNAQVKAFGVKMEAYKAEAAVYEVKIKGAMAYVDLYKAEIDALQAMTQVDRAKIDVYKARIESLQAYASIWKTQIEAVLGRVSLEKLRVDAFQAQVQAYSAMVQGKNAEWQGYEAAINGETAKAKMFATQVDAYSAQVNGAKAKVEALSEVARSAAVTNQARASQYSATLQGYSAVVNARGDVAKLQVDIGRQKLTAFQAETQYEIARAQLLSDWYKATSNVAVENNRMQIQSAQVDVDLFKTTSATVASLAHSNAQTYASLAGAAMSGMNSLVSQTEAL